MRKITFLDNFKQNRTSFEQAETSFYKYCTLKNLSKETLTYYKCKLTFFHSNISVKYIDEITQEMIDDFIINEINGNRKTSTLNSVLRALRAFIKFCEFQGYLNGISVRLVKEDEIIKEPYSDEEIKRLLVVPKSNSWVELRNWASVNFMVATGNRVSTVINLKIADLNFDEMTIHLSKVKNRHQQVVPMSHGLKSALEYYLSSWKWKFDDFLFPSSNGNGMSRSSFEHAIINYNHSRKVLKTSCHLFRHYFAKNYIMNGGGMAQLQSLLGHSSLEMTRHYIALYGSDLQKDYERLNPLDNLLKQG